MAKKRIATFLGPNKGLSVAGDYAYAYGGLFTSSTTETNELLFTTGNYLFVGIFQLNGPVDDDAPALVNQAMAKLTLNGTPICIIVNSGNDGPFDVRQNIIIPSNTEVRVDVVANGNESDRYGSVTITGRIYRDA